MGLYGLLYIKPATYTLIWTLIFYIGLAFGTTAGYHRLWAHKAYKARNPTKLILLLLGTATLQRSVIWWVRDHRAHHKYTDTEKDPYNARQGFWYAHMGWLVTKSEPAKSSQLPIPMDDLYQDPLIRWQYEYYVPISTFMAIIFPVLVCCLWGDFWGGIFYSVCLRQVVVYQTTFIVNSIAHYWGDTPYADEHTPRDSIITAIFSFGEGYHNFHHEFPSDYRNAIKFYQYDPTKWFIAGLSYIGQTYDLKITPERIIKKSEFQMKQKELEKIAAKVDWGIPKEHLPIISRDEFFSLSTDGRKLVIIHGVIHDVSDFILEHPGGTKIVEPYFGKDATHAFSGGVYYHSNAARNTLHQYRIGVCSPEDDWASTIKDGT
eukprot:Phypoly_transcript_09581.p1 GENE.Phypoly_transcript_09581~~Phypoly_transcript_09581.p1  ORF type:complete len:436 (+),score=43.44 Phypoly_transcript_09581:183-1310(+)